MKVPEYVLLAITEKFYFDYPYIFEAIDSQGGFEQGIVVVDMEAFRKLVIEKNLITADFFRLLEGKYLYFPQDIRAGENFEITGRAARLLNATKASQKTIARLIGDYKKTSFFPSSEGFSDYLINSEYAKMYKDLAYDIIKKENK